MSGGGSGGKRSDPAIFIIGGVLIVAIVAIFLMRGARDADVSRTTVGFQGLVEWLDENGFEARRFQGGGSLRREDVGLRIWPIHDDNLLAEREPPENDMEYLLQTSEFDQDRWVALRKAELLDTMIVLPKWRTGSRVLRVGHEILLVPDETVATVLDQIGLGAEVVRGDGFATFSYVERLRGSGSGSGSGSGGGSGGGAGDTPAPGNTSQDKGQTPAPDRPETPPAGSIDLDAVLYAPQAIAAPRACVPVIGSRNAMILGDCNTGSGHVLLLTDPDLLSNQGLRLGDNAEIALALARRYAGGKQILYDTTNRIYAIDPTAFTPERRDRSWEDLARIFGWPFTVIWAAAIALAAIVTWRSWIRYGPPARPIRDGLRAAKEVSIAAKGRLLRLSGHDAKLLETWAQSRCQRLAAEILGPHRPHGEDPVEQVARVTRRRNPELAREFEQAAAQISRTSTSDLRTGEGDLIRRLDRFETILERVLDEFGRASGARV